MSSFEDSTTTTTTASSEAPSSPAFPSPKKKSGFSGSSALVAMLKMKQGHIESGAPTSADVAPSSPAPDAASSSSSSSSSSAPSTPSSSSSSSTTGLSPVLAMLKQKQAAIESGAKAPLPPSSSSSPSSSSPSIADKIHKSALLHEIKSTPTKAPSWTLPRSPAPPSSSSSSSPGPSPALLSQIKSIKCAKCEKSVYKAEEAVALGRSWHKSCFTCGAGGEVGCGRVLQANSFKPNEGLPYCNACFTKSFSYLSNKAEGESA